MTINKLLKSIPDMRNNSNIDRMKIARRLIVCCLLLWCFTGSVMAQNDPQYVIKKDGNYLAHVRSGSTYNLTNAATFNPSTCLWYSGPNVEYNYYFIDNDGVRRYLSAPLALNGTLGISETTPATVILNKPNENYYFYDWDDGLARGVQLDMEECAAHSEYHGIHGSECWKVVWVSYEGGSWQMSSVYGYDPTPNAARFKRVTIHSYAAQVIPAEENPGGAPTIADFAIAFGDPDYQLNGTASNFSYTYTPAYTSYAFDGNTYYFDANGNTIANAPTPTTITNDLATGYAWTLTGQGADYLSIIYPTTSDKPKVSCTQENTSTSHLMATLTLTVTYSSGGTEVRTAIVTVKTTCQNPLQDEAPVVSYEDVTLSWLPTADKYKLEYKKSTEDWDHAVSISDITATTYTIGINDLEYKQNYDYRVAAYCNGAYLPVDDDEFIYHFTTHAEPDVIILGAVYGGGRMADVTGNTEVLMINCDSVNGVFGGNDIAGTVSGGSTITMGVNEDDANATAYNGRKASSKVRVFDVYGGGNGYYAYNGTSIVQASYDTEYNVDDGSSIMAITPSHPEGEIVWTNNTGSTQNLVCPTISTANIIITNDSVKIDTLFGGAKNAILNNTVNDVNITINGGTLYAVFGGNNYGGSLGYKSKEIITVNNTTLRTDESGYYSGQLGRDFGIGYLYGGGNKVQGQHVLININGGQMDTIFGGGNSADVRSDTLNVNCNLANTYSTAIYSHSGSAIDSINAAYPWNGYGVYNVRTLFGGNNKATMSGLPVINLTSGSLGTVYGGGNAGDMLAHDSIVGPEISFDPTLHLENLNFEYGTKVVVNSPTILIDYLYGGCQMSNVGYSTWVRILNGHVGTVYGGCNISGDVGSTRWDMSLGITDPHYQDVHGATYVEALGGTIHTDIFAGGNGYYHCVNGSGVYIDGINYDPGHSYVGMTVPTHNETHVVLNGTVIVNRNVYAGGNMAPVGFTHTLAGDKPYPSDVGLASVRMIGGEVKGDVYGGGNMASINGSNEVRVAGGSIGTGPDGGALYGGNDRLGKAGGISNRVLPDTYNTASDNNTPLISTESKVKTYIAITGSPYIHTVYGGGNGDYDYEHGAYCDPSNKPIQSNIFVDIAIDGGDDGGYIENVYGGGNGVHALGFIKVFLNVQNCTGDTRDHVGTIFGGNNLGDMDLIPDIILFHGNVHTVYGGCNKGGLVGDSTLTVNDVSYEHIGGYVHLRDVYTVTNTTLETPVTYITPTTASVTGAVYGGCRMNGVTKNTLVLVDGGTHPASMFGGSDISGNVGLTSRVIVNGGTTGNIYGGGNGNYYYEDNHVYDIDDHSILIDTITTGTVMAPVSAVSRVEIMKGNVGTGTGDDQRADVYGGGLGERTSTTGNVDVIIGTDTASLVAYCPTVYGDIYGGSALGAVNTNNSNTTTVDVLNGTIKGNIYGGGLGRKGSTEPVVVDAVEAKNYGKVYVNIGKSASYNCFLDLREANVFGCNNANGSPQDDVTVNVYQTAHSYTTYPVGVTTDNYLASYSGNNPQYSIRQVFGGGNEANYAPLNSGNKTTVNVYGCNNTIGRTFGGGNAADAYAVVSNIEGGRFHQVFGGGNGDPTAANIGAGGATLNVYGGNILQLFGCNNLNGEVNGPLNVNVTNTTNCPDCPQDIAELFGGSNKAVMGTTSPVNLTTTIECSDPVVNIGAIYGGSNLADITGDVTLNIKGGTFTDVFAGSKGRLADPGNSIEAKAANIKDNGENTGNVTLNLYGGQITNAFGGSNINGNIEGNIVVNVFDLEASCGLDITNIYGASNQTAYTPNNESAVSPVVNVIHIAQTEGVKGNIYGGGNLAGVTANPKVNIGYDATTMYQYIPKDEDDNPIYPLPETPRAYVTGNVFGGGNQAGVTGDPVVNMNNGTVVSGIYGGCNTSGIIAGDINVNIYNGTLGTSSVDMTEGIFGGGKGQATQTTGDVTVTIGDGTTPNIYADVYGGSALGQVGAAGKTAKVDLKNGTVNGKVFGGGEGDNTYTAEVTGDAQLAIAGNVTQGVYGGCNLRGVVKGNAIVGITGGTIGASEPENHANVYGGGLGENTVVNGNVAVTVNNDSGHIYGDVYGGSAKGVVNCTWDTDHYVHTSDANTGVTLTAGTIHGDLYGGGHGLESHLADVYGDVTVNVNGGRTDNVFGCNNLKGQPKNNVKVIINETTPSAMSIDSVFGGGNQAYYEGTPQVEIREGTVNYKVFGGGNNIADENKGVAGSDVLMVGGTVLGGIYGGCNTNGDVTGDVLVRLTGGTIGADDARANIHGGGYGRLTTVKGNVTVTFGDLTVDESEYPKLYGDLYGGSALGSVNDASSDLTTVNVYNGTITGTGTGTENYGNVFGGGLGSSAVAAMVNGEVHVNVGSEGGGKATLVNCNVFGCNNVNGSPQDNVYVDLYQTAHTIQNAAGYFDADRDFAIYQLFGGGNRAHYAPENGLVSSSKKTHVTIHDCDNTVNYVYGGGNAADAVGVVTIIQGGRFNEIYGGGNGQETAANVGEGGMGLNVLAGNVSFLFRGSNKNGDIAGEDYVPPATTTCSGGLFVDSYFFGTNEAELYYDLNNIIQCADAGSFEYRYVYAGSRWGIVYGDISLTVCGGTIENLFGGCRGYERYSADVRRFPTFAEITEDLALPEENRKYSQALRDHMGYDPENPSAGEPSYAGHGGNINLVINGGTIGKVFGGCDIKGNVEGKITVTINDADNASCPLFVGEVYGASNRWYYEPNETHVNSPVVQVLKGTIGGSHTDLPVNNISGTAPTEYEGNVFGGGNFGDIASNPIVIIGDGPTAEVTVKGNVFGGGNEGDVDGSPKVTIVPVTHTLSITAPSSGNYVRVTTSAGETVTSGASIGEGMSLDLVAIPSVAGYAFSQWNISGEGASVVNDRASSTSFTMGTGECSIEAVFSYDATTLHELTFGVDPEGVGTLVVKDAQGNTVSNHASVGEGSVLTLVASPDATHKFKKWIINTVDNTSPSATTYTMGASATNIIAVFEDATTHVLTFDATPGHGTVGVTDNHDQTVTSGASVGEGAVLSVTARPATTDYSFNRWTVTGNGAFTNVLASETSFTMENGDATIAASFVPNHSFNIASSEHGTIKVTNALGHTVTTGTRIGEGAKLTLKATPEPGYAFKEGHADDPTATIENMYAPITTFTMGTNNVTIDAEFVLAHVLTITPPENGTVKVTNVLNQTVNSGASIGENAVLTLKATHADGHNFIRWEVTGGTLTGAVDSEENTFIMGEGDATITAIFN